MTALAGPRPRRVQGARDRAAARYAARLSPPALAALLAIGYLIAAPPSLDLAAELFRARLFGAVGFTLWNNWWYTGHDLVGYSVLFPAVAWLLTPQLAGALAAIGSAAVFERLARRHFGARAWLGATLFGAATAIDLFCGRLTYGFGLLPGLGAVAALDTGLPAAAVGLALLCAFCSPVAALFTALAGGAHALARSRSGIRGVAAGAAVALAALAPLGAIAVAFPEGGREPFGLATLLPLAAVSAVAVVAAPRRLPTLRAGAALYLVVAVGAYVVPSPLGANVARLGTMLAAPVAALLWWPDRRRLLALTAPVLLVLGWSAPIRDVADTTGQPSTQPAFYAPLNGFLTAQAGPPFRVEIPFTAYHWEAAEVAGVGQKVSLARGWERQLDVADNPLFYSGRLTAPRYDAWLHADAVRFVAVAAAPLDPSARTEVALIDRGLPFLRLVARPGPWRVYAVRGATPIVTGAGTLTTMGADWLALRARAPGTLRVRVHYTPYWALTGGAGCVQRAGTQVRLTVDAAGPVRLVTRFALNRIGADGPRCAR